MTSSLSPCRHRAAPVATDRWICNSPMLVIPGRVVTSDLCGACPYKDHPVHSAAAGSTCRSGDVSPSMSAQAFIDALHAGAAMPSNWPTWQVAQCAHRLMFDRAAQQHVRYPGTFEGRGIVMAAGGPVYFACAFVSVSVLRALGCTLPVEFWHLGPDEITEEMRRLVEPLGVVCRDAHEVSPRPRKLGGWQLKPFAIMHSRFEQVLFMDADNIPAADPTFVFDDPRFADTGAIFWPDLPLSFSPTIWIPPLSWDVAGIAWREGPPFESGQLLVDKQACWRELNLTMHLNEHSDFWYRYVYGDKDTFKLAWHKVNRRYAMPVTQADWKWPAIFQHDLNGRLIFTHTCQGKRELVTGERLEALPMCDAAAVAGLEYQRWLELQPSMS